MPSHQRSRQRIIDLIGALGPGPWTLSDVRNQGWTKAQIRQAVDQGRLLRPRRGSLTTALDGSVAAESDPLPAIRRRAAVLLNRYADCVVSHESAGILHQLWLPRRPGNDIQLISPRRPDRDEAGVRVHGSRLPRWQVVNVEGLSVTSIARTAIDVARGRSIEDAVLVFDSAARAYAREAGVDLRRLRTEQELRSWWTAYTQNELWDAYRSVRGWPFTVVVRSAIPLLDPASESPFESRSRIRLASAAVPTPRVAAPVLGASGTEYYVDFLWDEWRVIGEADGTGKYGTDPDTVRSRLRAERRRQRDLEDAGWTFARWESTEPGAAMVGRVRRALSDRGWRPVSLG